MEEMRTLRIRLGQGQDFHTLRVEEGVVDRVSSACAEPSSMGGVYSHDQPPLHGARATGLRG